MGRARGREVLGSEERAAPGGADPSSFDSSAPSRTWSKRSSPSPQQMRTLGLPDRFPISLLEVRTAKKGGKRNGCFQMRTCLKRPFVQAERVGSFAPHNQTFRTMHADPESGHSAALSPPPLLEPGERSVAGTRKRRGPQIPLRPPGLRCLCRACRGPPYSMSVTRSRRNRGRNGPHAARNRRQQSRPRSRRNDGSGENSRRRHIDPRQTRRSPPRNWRIGLPAPPAIGHREIKVDVEDPPDRIPNQFLAAEARTARPAVKIGGRLISIGGSGLCDQRRGTGRQTGRRAIAQPRVNSRRSPPRFRGTPRTRRRTRPPCREGHPSRSNRAGPGIALQHISDQLANASDWLRIAGRTAAKSLGGTRRRA